MVETAHKNGVKTVMTTSLESDVPVGYFSWSEYDFMKPLEERKDFDIAAFISNCGAVNFRLEAMKTLSSLGLEIDSYGNCLNNKRSEGKSKLEILSNYKFYCAFENSNEPDYVTEKFLHALVSGSVPIYIGAPNIADFEPQENSVIHIATLEEVPKAAEKIKYLLSNESAFTEMLAWKKQGPSSKFLALVDMAVVHSSCRLCIHVATDIRLKEYDANDRPFKCQDPKTKSRVYEVRFRERGKFEFFKVFFEVPSARTKSKGRHLERLKDLFIESLMEVDYSAIWDGHRVDFLKSVNDPIIYRIYPVGTNQKSALYGPGQISNDKELLEYLKKTRVPMLEIILI